MDCADASEPAEYLLVVRRNNSLTSAGRAIVFGSLAVISLAISLAFAFLGAWLVFPFAGAEMVVLFFAFRYVDRHAADYESITIQGDRVLVERWETGRVCRFELNRWWAQVVLNREQPGRTTLALRSHGRQVEFGHHLTQEQREALAQTLREQLRNPH